MLLWTIDDQTSGPRRSGAWTTHELPFEIAVAGSDLDFPSRILATDPASHPQLAVLIAPEGSGLRVNGVPPLAVTVLDEKDEIRASDGRVLLVAAYQGEPRMGVARERLAQSCPVCTRPIDAGEKWVSCRACSAVYHAEPPLEPDGTRRGQSCERYDTKCRSCLRRWEDMQWQPAELGYGD